MRNIERQPLLTTVAGSYPTLDLPPRRAIQAAVEDQIAAGVELISDGQVRGDMLSLFARHIPGMRQGADGQWEVDAALDLPADAITVSDYVFARDLAASRAVVKGIVTGPITLALSTRIARGAPYTGPDDPALILRLAEILGHEVAALAASGARYIQIDEPALSTSLGVRVSPELAFDALRSVAALAPIPILHACGDVRAHTFDLLLLPCKTLAIENTRIANLAAFDDEATDFVQIRLAAGCVDTQTDNVEPIEIIRERVRDAASRLDPSRLWITPDCGLRRLPREVAREKLRRMVQAVQDVRADL